MDIYAYLRVSTDKQSLERQQEAIKRYCPSIEERKIFKDIKTGKTFDRPEYQLLKRAVSSGDTLVIMELDRLGRNKQMIKDEFTWFSSNNITLRILNIPTTLIDFTEETQWIQDMVNNILLEVLASEAENELHRFRDRQAGGIAVAQAAGKYKGRKPISIDTKEFVDKIARIDKGELTAAEAMRLLSLKPNTFYRRLKEYRALLVAG